MSRFIINPLVGLGTFLILFFIFRQLCFILAKYDEAIHKLDDNKFFKGLDADYVFGYFITIIIGIAVLLFIYLILAYIGYTVIDIFF